MKRPLVLISAALVALVALAAAALWSAGASGHSMGGEGTEGGDHAAMMKQCESMMGRTMSMMMPGHGSPQSQAPAGTAAASHVGTGVVCEVDAARGLVAISHGPIASLRWPAMTMSFVVKDKALLDKLAVNKKVEVEFVQLGADYVVIAVK